MDYSTSSSTGSENLPSHAVYLNICTEKEKHNFLKEILSLFLEVVDPQESGLLDKMIAEDLLTDYDRDSLSGKDVRTCTDLRRKVWFHLTKLSVQDLKTKVFPKLHQDFPHIIPKKFLTYSPGNMEAVDGGQGNECFRHDITRRLRRNSVLDKMYQYDIIDLETYRRRSTEGGATNHEPWTTLYSMAAFPNSRPSAMMKDILEMHRIPVPADLTSLISRGFPCTCSQRNDVLPDTPSSYNKVLSWIKELPLRLASGSPGSTRSTKSTDLYSISSQYPPYQAGSVNTTNSLSPSSAPAAFPPQDDGRGKKAAFESGRGKGEVDTMSAFVCRESPQISVAAAYPNPPESLQTLNSNSVEIHIPALAPTTSHTMEVMGIQDEVHPRTRGSGVQGSANQPLGTNDGLSLTGVPVSLNIRKLAMRFCLSPITILVVVLVLIFAMNGFNIVQFISGSPESDQNLEDAVRKLKQQDKQLVKNVTFLLDLLRSNTDG
ncbi:hypothetical protein ACOMHN_014634 [Nucella lapillus]